MPRIQRQPFTHVLIRAMFDSAAPSHRPWYWQRQCWLNDPVIGAQPADITIHGPSRHATQRAAMLAGIRAAEGAV